MDTFRQFIAKYPARTYKKGEMILLKSERPTSVYIIESGSVKTYSITADGSERLVSIDAQDEEFPIGYAYGIIETSDYFYEAFTKCKIRLVARQDYLDYLASDIHRLQSQYVRVTKLLLGTLLHIHALEQTHAREKIAYLLIYIARQLGVSLLGGEDQVAISVTQQEIANMLGIARETTNAELKKLEALGLITCGRKSYVIHTEHIRTYLELG